MQALAPRKEALEKKSLHSWMYPETINLQVVTKQGILTVVKRDDLPIHDLHSYITEPQVLAFNLPHHMVSDIQVITLLYPYVYKIIVKGQTMVAKLGRSSAHDSITDEIKKLYAVQTSAQGALARVPQLKGFVSSPKGVVGFLTNYIASLCYNLEYLLVCARATGSTVPKNKDAPSLPAITISKARKEKWTSQIQETLQSLHSRNVIWGDAKLANILIDEVTDDAWIVDFGGGHTVGWIERDLHGSKAGDLQALVRITAELAAV
jgi:serine/threonine protein kinase